MLALGVCAAPAGAKVIHEGTDSGTDHFTDDGCGFIDAREGRGLINMRTRARALDAGLDIASSPSGTTLTLHLPLSG